MKTNLWSIKVSDTKIQYSFPSGKHRLGFIGPILGVIYILGGSLLVAYEYAIRQRLPVREPTVLILVSILFMLVLGIEVIELLWLIKGVEIVEITDKGIALRHKLWKFTVSSYYQASKINGIFVSIYKGPGFSRSDRSRFFGYKYGAIAFNCGKSLFGDVQSFRFGSILDDESAEQIVSKIHHKFPQYIYRKPD